MHGQNFNFIYFLMGMMLGLFLSDWDINYIDYDDNDKEDEDNDFSKQKEKEEKQNKKNS